MMPSAPLQLSAAAVGSVAVPCIGQSYSVTSSRNQNSFQRQQWDLLLEPAQADSVQ